MPCYHPLKAWQIGYHDSGKPKYKITGYDVHHVSMSDSGIWKSHLDSYVNPLSQSISEFTEIPCGKCTGCRLAYSRDWANRCMLELEYHDSAYFVTLTYDPDHLPHVVDDDGVVQDYGTLYKRDLQLFWKRLRKAFPNDHIRYFACGEYGDKTARPHYHAIIYGLHLDDLVPSSHRSKAKLCEHNCCYVESKKLTDVWSNGMVIIGNVEWNSCAYVSRYIMKKRYGKEKEFYETYGLLPEFTIMSRKPGIARQYYDDHKETLFDSDFINLSTSTGGKRISPQLKYFKSLYEFDYPEDAAVLKAKNKKFAEDYAAFRLASTSQSYLEMLQTEENVKLSQIKNLRRTLE